MTTPEQQIAEAREICALIRAGKPVPCGKGPADEYLLALDDALSTALSDSKRKDEEIERVRQTAESISSEFDLLRTKRLEADDRAEAAESRLKDAEAALAKAQDEYRMHHKGCGWKEKAEELEAALAEARRESAYWKRAHDDMEEGARTIEAERGRLAGEKSSLMEKVVMAQAAVAVMCEEFKDSPKWREGLHDKIIAEQNKWTAALASPAPKEDR